MPSPTLPRNVRDAFREAWSEEVANDFSGWLDDTFQQRTVSRDEWREVLSRLDGIENEMEMRFERVDERFEHVEEHLRHVDERFDALHARIDERFDAMSTRMDERSRRIDEKLGEMNDRILSMTRWLIGLLVLFGTMVTVLLAVAQFTAA